MAAKVPPLVVTVSANTWAASLDTMLHPVTRGRSLDCGTTLQHRDNSVRCLLLEGKNIHALIKFNTTCKNVCEILAELTDLSEERSMEFTVPVT